MVVVVQAALGPEISNRRPVVDFLRPRLGLLRGLWELQLLDKLRAFDAPHHGAQVGQLEGLEGILRPTLKERGREVRQAPVLPVGALQPTKQPAHFCGALLGLLQNFRGHLVWVGMCTGGAPSDQQLRPTSQVRPESFRLQNSAFQLVSLESSKQGPQEKVSVSEVPELLPGSGASHGTRLRARGSRWDSI